MSCHCHGWLPPSFLLAWGHYENDQIEYCAWREQQVTLKMTEFSTARGRTAGHFENDTFSTVHGPDEQQVSLKMTKFSTVGGWTAGHFENDTFGTVCGRTTGHYENDHVQYHTWTNSGSFCVWTNSRASCALSPFLTGRTFVREHSWEYSVNIVNS